MTGRISIFTLLLSLLFSVNGFGQEDTIRLDNPSFEDYPRAGRSPMGWIDCGFPGETPPDIQPSSDPSDLIFANSKSPYNGQTYLGLVVRDNDTWERVSQRLSSPIKRGECYEMSMYLARAKNYISLSKVTKKDENYNEPIKVRVYGGNAYCNKKELLGESDLVTSHQWKKFEISFKTIQSYNFITIEAYYKTPSLFPYNGNVLIDEVSPIVHVPCDDEPLEPLVKITDPGKSGLKVEENFYKVRAKLENIENKSDVVFKVNGKKTSRFSYDAGSGRFSAGISLVNGNNEILIEGTNEAGTAEDQVRIIWEEDVAVAVIPDPYEDPGDRIEPTPKPIIIPELGDVDRLREGQELRVNKLYFPADSFRIKPESYPVLDEIYHFLRNNEKVVIEIGGHTNDRCEEVYCQKLSEERAKSVANYLSNKGISRTQLKFKGYGKEKPLVSNKTSSGRQKNQRVQIKILSLDG